MEQGLRLAPRVGYRSEEPELEAFGIRRDTAVNLGRSQGFGMAEEPMPQSPFAKKGADGDRD